ncbi:trypsin-like peptidase domain-containing protein [Streptomyces sp. NPDC048845]|uniref:VMAP-C domain-containing protein n=1 Tax=Streptomyces sp. NPDC048845 TaxID=3155390 RepID=UPI00343F509F
MGWFRQASHPAPVVSVLGRRHGKASGAAALLTPRALLTCAHVVNDALGRDMLSEAPPPAGHPVEIAFHGAEGVRRRSARVGVWVPPQRTSPVLWTGDLAVLELTEDAPDGHRPVVWQDMEEGCSVRAWHGGGEAVTFADTKVKFRDGRFGYLDGELSGVAIGPGFSGGPLWSVEDASVVGLVVAHLMPDGPLNGQQTVRRSWAVPWQTVREELDRAGAGAVLGDCRVLSAPAAESDPVAAELDGCLRALLGDPLLRADSARALAAELGWPPPAGGSAPALGELVSVLLSEERALPALAEALAPSVRGGPREPALDSLLGLGGLTASGLLMSPREHKLLLATLRPAVEADPALLPRAAAEALRHLALPPALCAARLDPAELDGVVRELEVYSDSGTVPEDSARVPALVRLVEFAAAVLPDTDRGTLHRWNDRLTERLGVARAALAQRRADAAAWAGERPRPVSLVLVRLTAGGPPGTYGCEIWQVRDGAEYTRLSGGDGVPRGGDEVARLVREAVECSRGAGGAPVTDVHVVVDRAGLQLPVDEWDAGSGSEFVPGLPLGVRFRVALRCPEMSRRVPSRDGELRRRWESGGAQPLVLDGDAAEPREAGRLLQTSHRDTRQVVLHGPREARPRLVDLCLALGVPVVLWDRAAHAEGPAALDPVAPAGPLHGLAHRVQLFRSEASRHPERYPARPALVWEDTACPLPGALELKDPPEGTDI